MAFILFRKGLATRYIELHITHLMKCNQRPDGSAQRHLFHLFNV
jgi:hypothetical protein